MVLDKEEEGARRDIPLADRLAEDRIRLAPDLHLGKSLTQQTFTDLCRTLPTLPITLLKMSIPENGRSDTLQLGRALQQMTQLQHLSLSFTSCGQLRCLQHLSQVLESLPLLAFWTWTSATARASRALASSGRR